MKMILLFRFLTKKPKTVRQEFCQRFQVVLFSFVLLISIVVFPDKETFAANAVVLKDEELDAVYAEGLSIKFDVSVVKPTNGVNNAPQPLQPLRPLQSLQPLQPTQPYKLVLNAIKNNDQSKQIQATLSKIYPLPASPVVQAIPAPAFNAGSVLGNDIQPSSVSPLSIVPGNQDTTQQVSGTTPVGIIVSQPASDTNLAASQVGNSGMNVVMVGDSAQQYLSSLVNVNAAGSVVPVLINIVVDINSHVNNLSNVNKLNLNDYYRYSIR